MTPIQKINQLISKSYTIKVSSYTTVYEDDYIEGEATNASNSWSGDSKIINSTEDTLEADIRDGVLDYLENELYVSDKYLTDSLRTYADEDYFYYSKFVDADNDKPSESQVDEWKNGGETLYVQNISITVSVNGVNLPMDILIDIFKEHISVDSL